MRKRFGRSARSRDVRVTVSQQSATNMGRDAYENGKIKTTGFTTFKFWGDVTDMKDKQGDIKYAEYKRLQSRVISIMADSRTVARIQMQDTLTLDNSTDVFEVMDVFDTNFKFTSEIIAKYKR